MLIESYMNCRKQFASISQSCTAEESRLREQLLKDMEELWYRMSDDEREDLDNLVAKESAAEASAL